MGQSYRIRTELGINKSIDVQLDQEFEFLEILSLKIQQEDIYNRSCAEYGVVVGRVTANNGFGLPNARVAVFVPIESIDESNPLITSIYPYKSPTDKNEDGYRYNLLPYEKSYSAHAATGTLPTRLDSLTATTAIEIYDKYYKLTAKTNESGDYMIMGVPQGNRTLVLDVDLSDIGEFSLTPQDLIRMGIATEAQVAGNRFKTSNDLNSLPQLVNLVKSLEVSPLWGEPDICDISINRVDFDLRNDGNIDIQPTSVFMGSIYSASDSFRVRENAKPNDDMGNLCLLTTGPGQIIAIRQTINQDSDGNPILETYQMEQAGNVIDGNGVWLTEMPMNLDYFYTNEFGEKILSNDPTVGIPTKGKYRFKIKWAQPPSLSEQTRRPYYLVPNVKEYGWATVSSDPNYLQTTSPEGKELNSSYYFGLDWSGYTNGFSGTKKLKKLTEAINCEDTFYQFEFNRVYTIAGLIDEFKKGGRGNFIGIKEIDSQDCESTVNKFPVNDGFRNFDLWYFIFAILLQIIQLIGVPLLIIYEFLAFLWNEFAVLILGYLVYYFAANAAQEALLAAAAVAGAASVTAWAMILLLAPFVFKFILWTALALILVIYFTDIIRFKFGRFKLPMMTYPDCQSCECDPEITSPGGGNGEQDSPPVAGAISQLSNSSLYFDNLVAYQEKTTDININDENYDTINQIRASILSQALAGRSDSFKKPYVFKTTNSTIPTLPGYNGNAAGEQDFAIGTTLPVGERINVYNTRKKYFDGVNRIKVTFASDVNSGFHYDNTLTILSTQDLQPGELLTFVNPSKTSDKNYLWTGQTLAGTASIDGIVQPNSGGGGGAIRGINGGIQSGQFTAITYYADQNNNSQNTNQSTNYTIPSGSVQCFSSVTLNITGNTGTIKYTNCGGVGVTLTSTTINTPIVIRDINGINISTLGGDAEYEVKSYKGGLQRYVYPSDIEYYQVLTAITITKTIVNGNPVYSLPSLGTNTSFWSTLNAQNMVNFYFLVRGICGFDLNGFVLGNTTNYPTSYFSDFESQKVVILQRGVDPYSPKLTNKYGIGKILGYANENDVTFTASTRMNIPIQMLPNGSTTSVQKHNVQDNIFLNSYFYTPGIANSITPGLQFSSYTTSNVGYYGALDSTYPTMTALGTKYVSTSLPLLPIGTANGVVSSTANKFYSATTADNYYDSAEDLSGGAILIRNDITVDTWPNSVCNFLGTPNTTIYYNLPPPQTYFSPILYPQFTATTGTNKALTISDNSKNIMRTDRLPSSDYIDNGGDLNGSVSLLQQNMGFAVYFIEGGGNSYTSSAFSTGASQVTPNIEGQIAATNVLETMGVCENMVGLSCYQGNGTTFGVKPGCQASDTVEHGCYVMMNNPLIDLGKDLKTFAEWGFRFRFFYGLCRGVLSQSFTNNWVNGSLYTFPIQVDTYFDAKNQPLPPNFAKELVYFDNKTNNFYYRSSPYLNGNTPIFIGKNNPPSGSVNKRNLLFPTTIVNLGIKDDFYQEIIFDPSAKGYIMKSLAPTSYSDTSDLVNLFVISRITDEGFVSQIVSGLNNSLDQLFTRPDLRIDGDLAQSMSINSEYGVIPFSPEYYKVTGAATDPVVILGSLTNPTMGIFFSSTTTDLQNKDYLSPGVIDFRPTNNVNAAKNAITYPYGINSQYVPFYQWGLQQPSNQSIFGSQYNNWVTTEGGNNLGIFGYNYQSLDRRKISKPSYFIGSNTQTGDIYERGYIFNVDSSGNFSTNGGTYPSNFLVGAPNHFYFGLIKGQTALDLFKTKYSIDE
jgi:hypothetical protein